MSNRKVGGPKKYFQSGLAEKNYARVGSQTPRNSNSELILVLVLLHHTRSYPFYRGIVVKIQTPSGEECGKERHFEVLIIDMKFRTKKQACSCLQLALLHANEAPKLVRFIVGWVLCVTCADRYILLV
jgi:hypothetical protein